MVTDIFGKVEDGTVIGDNLGTAVAARTGAGAVIDGGSGTSPGSASSRGQLLLPRRPPDRHPGREAGRGQRAGPDRGRHGAAG